MGSGIPLVLPGLLGLRRASQWNWMETLLWNSFLLENNVETAQKGSWEWGTPGIASGDQAAVLFLKPKTTTQMLQSSENKTNWELAFPIHGKPSHSWLLFQHLFQQFWFPMSGAICVSASSAHQLGPQGSQHLWLKGTKKENSRFPLFWGSHWQKRFDLELPEVEQNWNWGYQKTSSKGNCFLWVNSNSDPSSVCCK